MDLESSHKHFQMMFKHSIMDMNIIKILTYKTPQYYVFRFSKIAEIARILFRRKTRRISGRRERFAVNSPILRNSTSRGHGSASTSPF